MLGLLLGKTWSLFPVFHQFLEVRRLKWNYFILSAFSDTSLIRYKINNYDFFLIFKIYQPLQYCTCNWLSLLSSCSSNPCAVKVYLTWDKVQNVFHFLLELYSVDAWLFTERCLSGKHDIFNTELTIYCLFKSCLVLVDINKIVIHQKA